MDKITARGYIARYRMGWIPPWKPGYSKVKIAARRLGYKRIPRLHKWAKF